MPLTIEDARQRVERYFVNHLKDLLQGEFEGLRVGLKPPTAAHAADNYVLTQSFIRQWEGRDDVEYATRNWSSTGLGTVLVPQRLHLHTVEQLVDFAEVGAEWDEVRSRYERLTEFSVKTRISTISMWRSLSIEDVERISPVVRWFVENPDSGLLKRAVAVEGVHSKWLENHRALIEILVADARGEVGRSDLGLCESEIRVRLRLHPAEAPASLTDIEIPLSDLEGLAASEAILMVENLDTFLALPMWQGVVLVWGAGYKALEIAKSSYFLRQPLYYWGDLDIDGFKILDQIRKRVPHTHSVLMDPQTVVRWNYLAVADRPFSFEDFHTLTPEESDALDHLIVGRHLRIEQERIRLDVAIEALELVLGKGTRK